jgi:hypothetical protein
MSGATDQAFSRAMSYAGYPAGTVSGISQFNQSSAERTNPVREIDFFVLHDFFDHSGNCVNGYIAAAAVVGAGLLVDRFTTKHTINPIALGAAAAAVSAGVNIAYEAGVEMPPFPAKSPDANFDVADAAYGGVTGIIFAAVFCGSALLARRRQNKSAEKMMHKNVSL